MKAVIVLRNLFKGKKIKVDGKIFFAVGNTVYFEDGDKQLPSVISLNTFITACNQISDHTIQKIICEDYTEVNDGAIQETQTSNT